MFEYLFCVELIIACSSPTLHTFNDRYNKMCTTYKCLNVSLLIISLDEREREELTIDFLAIRAKRWLG